MTCLVYGIVFSRGESCLGLPLPQVMPHGVGGAPVRLIEANGLGAAVSTVEEPGLTPTVANALAYAKVVEAIHAQSTIMPMRYGCTCAGEDEAVLLLQTHGGQYSEILRRVEGCVELAVHVSLPCACPEDTPSPLVARGPSTAAAYLAGRASLYAARDQRTREVASATERIRAAFGDHYVYFRAGGADDQQAGVSAIFLVKRANLASFHAAFVKFAGTEPGTPRLSGPWPPYNFVIPEASHGRRPS